MIYCNFPQLDEPVSCLQNGSTVLTVENTAIYAQIIYSLYQQENVGQPDFPFLLFDDTYKPLTNLSVIQQPLLYDFNTANFKKLLFNRIISTLDVDERMEIERDYADLVSYFNQQIFDDIELEVSISEAYKLEELFKLLKINILDHSESIFEKCQLILNVLQELDKKQLIIFCGLGNFLLPAEYNLIIETANLNGQTVLFLENRLPENLQKIKQITLDNDYFCSEKMI
jgi:CRISPR type II-A-associated protein Csn2